MTVSTAKKKFGIVKNPTKSDRSDAYVTTQFAEYDSAYNNQVHYHNFYELEFIVDGKGIYEINNISYEAKRGAVFLTTPADYHTYSLAADENLSFFCVQFRQSHINEEVASRLYSYSEPIAYYLDSDECDKRIAEFDRLLCEFGEKRSMYELKVRNLIENICIDIIGDMDKKSKSASLHPTIKTAIIYVKDHYREPLTLSDTAERVGLSGAYFSHRFVEAVGMGFSTYVRYVRLTAAASLLKSTELSVKEVCYKTGFTDPNYFSGAFKSHFGVSPRQYRENAAASLQNRQNTVSEQTK